MMPLADLAQLAIAGKNRVAGRRRIVVGESIILAGDDGDGHGALQVSAGRAASAVLPCPQALPRPIARFAERRSGCGPQFRHRTPEGAQGLTTENCTRAAIEDRYRRRERADVGRRNTTGWLGWEDSNSEMFAKYPFERSHRFPMNPAKSGDRDYSRLSCGVGRRSSGLVPGSRQDACAGRNCRDFLPMPG